MSNQGQDWSSDAWFVKYHADKLSEDFKAWWLDYYGAHTDYLLEGDEHHEYWVRCAFAWNGWCAALNNKTGDKHGI